MSEEILAQITETPKQISSEGLVEFGKVERLTCKQDFRYFLYNYVWTYTDDGRALQFPKYAYLEKVIDMMLGSRKNVIKKSRQLLLSWLSASLAVWDCNFRENLLDLFISISEDDAWELKRKAQFLYDHLPSWMRGSLKYENKGEMTWEFINPTTKIKSESRILCLPSKPTAGSGYSPYRVFLDEAAKLQYGMEILGSVKPSVDRAGYLNLISSGYDKNTLGYMFNRIYENAPANGFKRIFLHYSEHPDKTAEWKAEAEKGYTPLQWNQNYEGMMEGEAGQPVYGNFNRIKSVKEIKPVLGVPMLMGWDTGYPQGIIWAQILEEDRRKKIFIYMDFTGEEKADDIADVAQRVIRLHQIEFPQWNIKNPNQVRHYGDPHGKNKEDLDKRTRFQKVREETGINILWNYHRSETAIPNICPKFNLQGDGEPDIYIHPRCEMLISGFAGGYHHKEYKEIRAYDPTPVPNIYSHAQKALEFIVNNNFCEFDEDYQEREPLRPRRKIYSNWVGGRVGTGL